MFNLEEFKENFEAGKISEWEFYSTLVRKGELSEEDFSASLKVDELEFDRFICLTGEKDLQKCQFMIDTVTGQLYSPKWFNENTQKFKKLEDGNNFVNQIRIGQNSNWKLDTLQNLHGMPIQDRVKWFKSDNYSYILVKNAKYITDGSPYKYYINQNDDASSSYSALPFITSDIYVDYGSETIKYKDENDEEKTKKTPSIWGKNFTNQKFVDFLAETGYAKNILKVDFNPTTAIPKILQKFQKETGVALHTDTIDFPDRLFNSISDISKHQNIVSYIDFLLWKIANFTNRNSENLEKANLLYSQLVSLKSENETVNKLKNYLLQKFDFSLQNLETKLIEFRNEAVTYLENNDSINSLYQFPKDENINFQHIGESLTRLYNNQILKVKSFSSEVDFLLQLSEKVGNLFKASGNFSTGQKEKLRQSCENEYVESEFEKLYSEWKSEVSEVEKRYFPVIQAYFNGNISQETTIHTLSLFEDLRNSIDKFFESERISLIQKYDSNPKSEFLQRVDMEAQLFKSCCTVRSGLKDVISEEEHHITKRLLDSQSQSLLSRQLSNLAQFSGDAGISDSIKLGFEELQGRNLDLYLSDIVKYGEELSQRDKDIQGLLFKMKKDLEREK